MVEFKCPEKVGHELSVDLVILAILMIIYSELIKHENVKIEFI